MTAPIHPKAGAQVSYATAAAVDAQRMLLSAILHAEAAGIEMEGLDGFFVDYYGGFAPVGTLASLLEKLGTLADALQNEADALGHEEVRRRAAA